MVWDTVIRIHCRKANLKRLGASKCQAVISYPDISRPGHYNISK